LTESRAPHRLHLPTPLPVRAYLQAGRRRTPESERGRGILGRACRRCAPVVLRASDRVERGRLGRWLGHSDPGFTLRTYVHLLNDDLGEPLSLPSRGVSVVSAGPTPTDATAPSEIVEAVAA
jgi:hypothetical protein